jgi:hypothetical protein
VSLAGHRCFNDPEQRPATGSVRRDDSICQKRGQSLRREAVARAIQAEAAPPYRCSVKVKGAAAQYGLGFRRPNLAAPVVYTTTSQIDAEFSLRQNVRVAHFDSRWRVWRPRLGAGTLPVRKGGALTSGQIEGGCRGERGGAARHLVLRLLQSRREARDIIAARITPA